MIKNLDLKSQEKGMYVRSYFHLDDCDQFLILLGMRSSILNAPSVNLPKIKKKFWQSASSNAIAKVDGLDITASLEIEDVEEPSEDYRIRLKI